MKKKFFALLLALAMSFGLLPSAAFAAKRPEAPASCEATAADGSTYTCPRVEAGEVYVAGTKVGIGSDIEYYLDTEDGGITAEGASEGNYNVSYDPSTGTLTLNNANLSRTAYTDHLVLYDTQESPRDVSDDAVIMARRDLTIVVIGTNTVENKRTGDRGNYNGLHRHGIDVFGDLIIKGNSADSSALTSSGVEKNSNEWANNMGVSVAGDLTIQDVSLTAKGEETTYCSLGLNVDPGSLVIENSVVTISSAATKPLNSATVADNWTSSYGMYLAPPENGQLVIDNSQVTVTAGPGYSSYGAAIGSTDIALTVQNGSTLDVTASKEAAGSCGIVGSLDINGGYVTAKSEGAKDISFTYDGETYAGTAYSYGYSGYGVDNTGDITDHYKVKVWNGGGLQFISGPCENATYTDSRAYDGFIQDLTYPKEEALATYNQAANDTGASVWSENCTAADGDNDLVLKNNYQYFEIGPFPDVYVFLEVVDENGTHRDPDDFTELETNYLEETLGLKEYWEWYTVGKLAEVNGIPKPTEKNEDVYSAYKDVILAALSELVPAKSATIPEGFLNKINWTELKAATGAPGYFEDDETNLYWHLDGQIQLGTLTYDANGGENAPGAVVDVSGATVDLNDGTGMSHEQQDGHNVLFLGWTTTNTNGKVYEADDTLPTIVEDEITLTGNTTVYAVWGVDEDGSGVADVNEHTVYVYVKFKGSGEGGALTPAEKQYVEGIYGGKVKGDGYMAIGYFEAEIPDVTGYTNGEDQLENLLGRGFVLNNGDMDRWANGVNEDNLNLEKDVEWTKLSVATSAMDFTPPEEHRCWHLDGELEVKLNNLSMEIQPADITIYTGGDGYEGATDEKGDKLTTNHGLPEPGFHITLPEALDEWVRKQAEAAGEDIATADLSKYLTFSYSATDEEGQPVTREWTLKYQGVYSTDKDGNPTQYVYSLMPAKDQDPISMLYFEDDGNGELDEDEKALTTDDIGMTADAPSRSYAMAINPNGLKLENVIAHFQMGDGETETLELKVETKAGKLTVKSVADEEPVTNAINGTKNDTTPTAEADAGVEFHVNETQVEIDLTDPENANRVQLLVDKVSDSEDFNANMEEDAISEVKTDLEKEGDSLSNPQAESYYLDLVDTQNGNTVVTMGAGDKLTIHWPMPEDANPKGEFHIVHYDGMNRESAVDGEDLSDQTNHRETAKISGDGKYIIFETSTFSPFVLVYEKQTYTITASAGTGGTIAPDGVTTVTKGGSQTYTITANGGNWYISDVLVDGVSVGAKSTYTFSNVDANHTIEAKFVYIPPYIPPTEDPDPEPTPDPDLEHDPEGLNTEDHVSYLIGYEDGTVRPEADITRAEVATIFFRLLEDDVRDANWNTTSGFPDVNVGDWFNTAVSTLTGMGKIIGYEDGTFRPNEPITRAEFVTIATRFYDYTAKYEPDTFPDVDADAWYADYIQAAVDMDLILGDDDGTFRPNAPITRAEAAAIVNRMLGRRPHEDHLLPEEDMNMWPDNSKDAWYYEDIQEATNSHTYSWTVEKDESGKYRTVEDWTAKEPDPDWVEIEQGWAAAKR